MKELMEGKIYWREVSVGLVSRRQQRLMLGFIGKPTNSIYISIDLLRFK
jgi:hypothetical protein